MKLKSYISIFILVIYSFQLRAESKSILQSIICDEDCIDSLHKSTLASLTSLQGKPLIIHLEAFSSPDPQEILFSSSLLKSQKKLVDKLYSLSINPKVVQTKYNVDSGSIIL